MDETLYAWCDLDEGSIVCHDDNLALHVVANLEVGIQCFPRMWGELLQTKCDALLLVVEVEDYDVDLLVEFHYFLRVADASP